MIHIGFIILEMATIFAGGVFIRDAVKFFKKGEYYWFGVLTMLSVFMVDAMALWFYLMFV